MYAIAFDLDQALLEKNYSTPSFNNAYKDIRSFLEKEGFTHQQGSVYFGDNEKIDAVKCVMTVNKLSRKFSWFTAAVTDVRMLRIEENNDLRPALE